MRNADGVGIRDRENNSNFIPLKSFRRGNERDSMTGGRREKTSHCRERIGFRGEKRYGRRPGTDPGRGVVEKNKNGTKPKGGGLTRCRFCGARAGGAVFSAGGGGAVCGAGVNKTVPASYLSRASVRTTSRGRRQRWEGRGEGGCGELYVGLISRKPFYGSAVVGAAAARFSAGGRVAGGSGWGGADGRKPNARVDPVFESGRRRSARRESVASSRE